MKKLLFLLLVLTGSLTLTAQQQSITGKVTDAITGEPLIGVSVVVKGTTTGTVTDYNGSFEVDLASLSDVFYTRKSPVTTLVFSYTGLADVEADAMDGKYLEVEMGTSAIELEEVVVSGAAVGRSPKTLSYAVGRVDRQLLAAVPAFDIGNSIQAKMPGVRVQPVSGQPGQPAYFQIRAANSLANGQQPLLIVDGVFLADASLADFNAEDIERIEVLKGSAGAALYGSQAANGVIQVFTYRGKQLEVGENQVIYRGEYGYSEVADRYPINTFTNREVLDANAPQPVLGNPLPGDFNTIPLPNLQDYQESILFQTGALRSNSLAVRGRSQQTNYAISGQRLRNEGVIQGFDGYTRHQIRVNTDHQISDKLDVQVSTSYTQSQQDQVDNVSNGPGSYLASVLFLTPMFDLDAPNEEDGSAYDWDIDNTGLGIPNPLYDRNNISRIVRRHRFLGNVKANYYATDWLTLSYSGALDRTNQQFDQYVRKGFLSTNIPGQFSNLATAGVQNSNGGGIQLDDRTSSYLTSRASLTVQRNFGNFNTAIRGSYLYEDLTHQLQSGIGEDLAVEANRSLNNARSNVLIGSEKQEVVGNSYFLIADVDYQEKYIFSGLFRREGSSLFGPENRWANYYRVSGAYRITEDIDLRFIKELKLRASIGTAGIRPTFDQRFETFDLVNGTTVKNTLGNNLLKPAQSTEQEIGIEAQLGQAFTLEVNYADIRTEDQILFTPLTAAAGFRGQWRNAGTVTGKVYEAQLDIDFAKLLKVNRADIDWNVMVNFTKVQQTVSQLDVASYQTGPDNAAAALFQIAEGQPLGTMVGEVFATDVAQLADQEGINPADYTVNAAGYLVRQDQLGTPEERPYKLVDGNGNPLIQDIGNITPDFRMGFAQVLRIKDFSLFAVLDWKKGGAIYNLTKQWLYRDLRDADISAFADVPSGFYGSEGLYNALVPNNHFVEDGSFLRLREASLSYTLNEQVLAGLLGGRLSSIRFSLIGRNLWTQTNYTGFNPDVSSPPANANALSNRFPDARGNDARTPNGDPSIFQVDAFNYPLARTMSFSLQVTF